jgi:hypothetical protein
MSKDAASYRMDIKSYLIDANLHIMNIACFVKNVAYSDLKKDHNILVYVE